MSSAPFRFDDVTHTYTCGRTGQVLPGITGMMKAAGLVDDTWFTEESCRRGQIVHELTAAYDLGALELDEVKGKYRGYVLGHVRNMGIAPHEWEFVEVALAHPAIRFAGRCDRGGLMYGATSVLEVKSGVEDDAHDVQTALQAILIAPSLGLPPEAVMRYVEYLREDGRARLFRCKRQQRDLAKAREILREHAA